MPRNTAGDGESLPCRTLNVMPPLSPQIFAVLVDAGGVLVHPNPKVIAEALRPFGVETEPDAVIRALYAAAIDDGALDSVHDVQPEADIWWRHNAAIAIGCNIAIDYLAAAVDALVTAYRTPDIHVYAEKNARKGLAALVTAGYRIAVVTNHDGTMESKLSRASICQVGPGENVPVSAITDSGNVGFAKPDPRIFDVALRILELEPTNVVHVGDTDADIIGAEAAGIRPVHFDPYDDCGHRADHEHIRALADLIS